jgi:cytochrome b6
MYTLQTSVQTIENLARRLATVFAVMILTLTLIAATSGILMAYYYQPTTMGAVASLKLIDQQVNYGWLVHRLHELAGNGLVALGAVQVVTMFAGWRQRWSWIGAWFSGILLTLGAIGLGWTAMILDWSQLGYWRLKIELGTIESIPWVGSTLASILTGGGIGSQTITHMFAIHSYLLAPVAVILAIGHLGSLLYRQGGTDQ